jgi:hypothetical protein
MKKQLRSLGSVMAIAVIAMACESKVTRPSVTFMAPLASQPANGSSYKYAQQPITLTFTNGTSVSAVTATYTIEVATDTAFASKVFTRENIAEGTGGTTSVVLTTLDGQKTYYWRTRATVDGTVGENTAARSFAIGPRVVVDKPTGSAPAGGDFYSTPTFTTKNAPRVGPVETMVYTFQLSISPSFSSLIAQANVNEGSGGAGGTTSWTPSIELPEGTLYWRVRATDSGTSEVSPFSDALSFSRKFGIDFNKVTYINPYPNISKWEQVATLTEATHGNGILCTYHSHLNRWPSADFFGDPSTQVEGNQWMFALLGGIWYAGAGHWYRPGQACKAEVDEHFFVDAFKNSPPFSTLVIRPGDEFGVAVSTPARNWPAIKTYDERSNALIITWR